MGQIEILDVLRRHIAMIIAVCVVATLAGYAFSFAMPEKYTVTALVLVRPEQPVKLGSEKENKEFLNFPMGNSSAVETASKTYIQIIKSPALLGQVVTELGLDKDDAKEGGGKLTRFLPEFLQPVGQSLKASLNGLMALLKYGRVIKDDPFTEAVKNVSDGLTLESHQDTYLFDIKYTGKDPQRAADVANTAASKLVQFVDEMRQSETGLQGGHLKAELEQSKQRLDATRARLESFKEAHAVFLPNTEYDAKLKVIGDLEVELAKTDAILVSSQNTLLTLSMKARRARLVQSLQERQAELAPLPGIERELTQLEQDVRDALTAYEVVDKEFREADMTRSAAVPEVQAVSAAIAPRLPTSPVRGTIALASFISGLVVAGALGFFLEYQNRRVRGIQDVEEIVGVKVLATIPRIALNRWRLVYRT
jgi:uncharacterized protein involved in exopolysaccharide biosynthesis